MTTYKPLTPELRRKILKAVKQQGEELAEAEQTPYISAWKMQNRAMEMLFKNLPDGYPIPIEK